MVDRRHFKSYLTNWLKQNEVQTPGPQFPWAWAEGGSEDLIWVKCQSLESENMAAAFKTIHSELSSKSSNNLGGEDCNEMIPVFFGRPHFKRDIASIGASTKLKLLDVARFCLYILKARVRYTKSL